jgi:hypothetical protein
MGTTLKDLKVLLEKVLQCEREEGRRHTQYFLKVNGRIVASTFYSRSWKGSTQIDDSILNLVAKEMKCSSTGLWKRLLVGQVTKDRYFQDLRDHGHITQEEYEILCGKGNTTTKR